MLSSFINKLNSGYWTHGSTWEFDWYIDVFFVEAMAYGKYPIKLGYLQPVLGDEFLEYKYKDKILEEYKEFYYNDKELKKLLRDQSTILKQANKAIDNLNNNKFESKNYKKVQLELSLLMASVSVVFDELMPPILKQLSNEENLDYGTVINYVLDKSNKTKLNESNQKLLKYFLKNKKEFINASFEHKKLGKKTQSFLEKHSVEYSFLNTGERGGKPWGSSDYLLQLRELSNIAPKKEINFNFSTLSQKNKHLLNSIIEINVNDNVAADKQVELDFLFQKFLQRQLGNKYDERIIDALTYEEIFIILNKPSLIIDYQPRKNIIRRVAWPEDGRVNLHYFETEKEYQSIVSMVKQLSVGNLITGTIACMGVAEGIVHIIKSKADLNSFQKGEILVAEKTQPQDVMAMTKANAIVTDVGGITSHAAIIAREFGIPAIVGTKNATRVYKNGDLIKVDANEGKIYKLS